MNCPKCGYLNNGNKFCSNCGTDMDNVSPVQPSTTNQVQQQVATQPTMSTPLQQPIATQPTMGMPSQQPVQDQTPKKKNNKIALFIAFAIVIVLAIVIIVSPNIGKGNNKDNNKKPNSEQDNSEIADNNTTNNDNTNSSNPTIGTVDPNTNLTYDENGAFLLYVDDVFTITGRGVVVQGHVARGKLKVGDTVQIIGLNNEILEAEVSGLEMFRKQVDEIKIGDNAGILLKNLTKEQIQIGQAIVQPNSMVAAYDFGATITTFTVDEGGRQTPFFDKYRPLFYIGNTLVTGVINLLDGVEMVMPGDTLNINVNLINNYALEVGTEFYIRDGAKTIAKGIVTKIY